MSIVRVGMSESKSFGDGYDAIFGKKKAGAAKKPAAAAPTPSVAKKDAPPKKAKQK